MEKEVKIHVWTDLETTGLDPQRDAILELAMVVTDTDLNELDTFETVIASPDWRFRAGKKVLEMHAKSGLDNLVDSSIKNLATAEMEACAFLDQFDGTLIMSGNNVASFDRQFIVNNMMLLNKRFYHRHVDVSALYEAYELAMGTDIRKPNTGGHRALADARGSIELFKQFKENFQ